jgi:glycine betaine catabolism B
MKLTFIGSNPVKGNVISFVFRPDERLTWQPGQYMHYVLPHPDADDRGTERWFTNSATPSEGNVMISTRIDSEHGSSFKRALLALKPGDTIEADGPEGDFTVEDETRNYIFVAGGIGITPFRSMLTEANNQGKKLRVTLLYANRDQDIPFKDELEKFAADNQNLQIKYIVRPESLDAQTIKQYADQIDDPLIYLSGPEPMVKSFAAELPGLGVSEESIKLDDFPGYEGI